MTTSRRPTLLNRDSAWLLLSLETQRDMRKSDKTRVTNAHGKTQCILLEGIITDNGRKGDKGWACDYKRNKVCHFLDYGVKNIMSLHEQTAAE